MKTYKKAGLACCCLFAVQTSVSAQDVNPADTIIRGTTIEIAQIYKPKVKQAPKEMLYPELPDERGTLPAFDYNVPEKAFHFTYAHLPLQALALTEDTLHQRAHNFVRLAAGNRQTIFGEAGIALIRRDSTQSDWSFGFLHQKGKLAYQQQTVANANGTTNWQGKKLNVSLNTTAEYRQFFQYGFDETLFPTKQAAKQTLGGAGAEVTADGHRSVGGWLPSANAVLSFYGGSQFSGEATYGLGFFALKKLNKEGFSARVGVSAIDTRFTSASYNANNPLLDVQAGIYYWHRNISARAVLAPTMGMDGNTFLLQDIRLRYTSPAANFFIEGGTKGEIRRNTYRSLFLMNPYFTFFTSGQNHSDEVYAFAGKGFGRHFSANARVSWWRHENPASFLNGTVSSPEQMSVTYIPRLNALSLKAEMRYSVSDAFSAGVQLHLYKFYNIFNNARFWHEPNTRLQADLLWHPAKPLFISANLSHLGGIYALDAGAKEVRLGAIVDLGVGGEYLFAEKFSAFVNVHNLLNAHYERWLGYEAYGINVFGGIRLKF